MSKSIYYVDAAKFSTALLNSGKSKQQIMAETGFSKQTINNMLREKYCKSYPFAMSTILSVAAACGVQASELLADDPKPEPAKECRLFDESENLAFDGPACVAAAHFQFLASVQQIIDGLMTLSNSVLILLNNTEAKP